MGGLVAAAALLPVAYLVIRASGGGLDLVRDTLWRDRTAALLARSAGLAIAVTTTATMLGVALAWLTVRCRLPLPRLWPVLCALPLAIPTYVAGFAYISTFPGLAGFRGAWLVLTLFSFPYVYLPVAAAWRGLDPAPTEVARSLGRSPLATFVTVTLRQLRPAVATGALLTALYVLSDFGAVTLMRFTTFTRSIYVSYQASFDRRPAAIYGCLLVVLTAGVVIAESRSRRGVRYDRVAGGAQRVTSPVDLGRWRWPATAAVAAVAALSLGVPAATLWRWTRAGTGTDTDLGGTLDAAVNSLTLSAGGMLAAVLAALPIAWLAARYRTRAARWLERAAYVGHALPGVVIALSLVFFAARYGGSLYQQWPVLVFGYVVLFLPLAVAAIYGAAAQLSPSVEDAARSLGTSPPAVWRRVTGPALAPGIGAGAALVFLTCLKELPATLLLRPTGTETLATRVWTETGAGAFAAAAPAAALLVAVAAVPTWLLTRRGEVW